jgi:hypothetical protein
MNTPNYIPSFLPHHPELNTDNDPGETHEWLEAFTSLLKS